MFDLLLWKKNNSKTTLGVYLLSTPGCSEQRKFGAAEKRQHNNIHLDDWSTSFLSCFLWTLGPHCRVTMYIHLLKAHCNAWQCQTDPTLLLPVHVSWPGIWNAEPFAYPNNVLVIICVLSYCDSLVVVCMWLFSLTSFTSVFGRPWQSRIPPFHHTTCCPSKNFAQNPLESTFVINAGLMLCGLIEILPQKRAYTFPATRGSDDIGLIKAWRRELYFTSRQNIQSARNVSLPSSV